VLTGNPEIIPTCLASPLTGKVVSVRGILDDSKRWWTYFQMCRGSPRIVHLRAGRASDSVQLGPIQQVAVSAGFSVRDTGCSIFDFYCLLCKQGSRVNREVWGQSEGQSKDTLTRGICNVPTGLRLNQSDSRVWSPTNWTTFQLFETDSIHIMPRLEVFGQKAKHIFNFCMRHLRKSIHPSVRG